MSIDNTLLLPISRDEIYYTATVLPGIICVDNFEHIGRFLQLLGLQLPGADLSSAKIQFFAEYNFAKAVFDPETRARFPNRPVSRDTPDIVILINSDRPVLVAIEAKMFSLVSSLGLSVQMARQRRVLDYLAGRRTGTKVAHIALLPDQLSRKLKTFQNSKLTWECVLAAYSGVKNAEYFRDVLRQALDAFNTLRAVGGSGTNADTRLTGLQICKLYSAGKSEFQTMGRRDGLDGSIVRSDIENGNWKTYRYEVSTSAEPANAWWFPIGEFVQRIPNARQA